MAPGACFDSIGKRTYGSLSLRNGLINGYDMLLTNQERDGSWGAFFTCF